MKLTNTATMKFGGGVTAILDDNQLTNVSKLSCSKPPCIGNKKPANSFSQ